MHLQQRAPHIYELCLGHGEQRIDGDFCEEFLRLMDDLGRLPTNQRCLCLITTAKGKIYSNGLNFDYIQQHPRPHDFLSVQFYAVLERLLTADFATIAAINGHAFAGGLVLAMAHDFRVMRGDRGWLCMNEVLLPGPIPPGMLSLLEVFSRFAHGGRQRSQIGACCGKCA